MNERVGGPRKIGRRVPGNLEQNETELNGRREGGGIRWREERERERREKVENVMEVKSRTKNEKGEEGK